MNLSQKGVKRVKGVRSVGADTPTLSGVLKHAGDSRGPVFEKGRFETMAQTCTVCRHKKREEIDQALLGGAPYRIIAKRFGASPAAVFRHGKDHISKALVKAKQTANEVEAGTLFERLRALNRDTLEILRDARESQNHVVALQAIGRVERQLELEARLLGELDNQVRVAVGISISNDGVSQGTTNMRQALAVATPDELQVISALFEELGRRNNALAAQPASP